MNLETTKPNQTKMKAYKLTTSDNKSKRGDVQWGENITHKVPLPLKECSNGIHFYTSPYLAVLMNPEHANIKNPNLWEGEASGIIVEEPLKNYSEIFTTHKQIEVPVFSRKQTVYFAITCAKQVMKDNNWNTWADKWISGKDRTHDASYAASYAAYAAAYDAASYAAYAAYAAAYALCCLCCFLCFLCCCFCHNRL